MEPCADVLPEDLEADAGELDLDEVFEFLELFGFDAVEDFLCELPFCLDFVEDLAREAVFCLDFVEVFEFLELFCLVADELFSLLDADFFEFDVEVFDFLEELSFALEEPALG